MHSDPEHMRTHCPQLGSLVRSAASLIATLSSSPSPVMETDHEMISTAIIPLPLIQEGQLSVNGESTYVQLILVK